MENVVTLRGSGQGMAHFLTTTWRGETQNVNRKYFFKKEISKGYIKTHHYYEVHHEERGNATGVAQEACKG